MELLFQEELHWLVWIFVRLRFDQSMFQTQQNANIERSAVFRVTGACYFWQFSVFDADPNGKCYADYTTNELVPNFSHHKLTVFEYADSEELGLYYQKVAKAFSAYQPTIDDFTTTPSGEILREFDQRVQENRIVGPLSDSRVIESLKFTDQTTDPSIPPSTTEVEVTTKTDHGYFVNQYVAISNTEIDDVLEGIFKVKELIYQVMLVSSNTRFHL